MKSVKFFVFLSCAALVSMASKSARGDTGDFWCFGTRINGVSSIPVKIHPDLLPLMKHSDNSAWTSAELEHELKFALERYMDLAPSDAPPLYFGGWELASVGWDDSPDDGTIAIRPKTSCGADAFVWPAVPFFAPHGSARIRYGTGSYCPQARQDHWGGVVPDGTTFIGVWLHELSHARGFKHMVDCNSPALNCYGNGSELQEGCGFMHEHGWSSEWYEPEFADLHGMKTKYGGWANNGRTRRETTNSSTWSTLASGPALSGPNLGSAWSDGSSLMPLAVQSSGDPRLYRWDRSSDSLIDWGIPYTSGDQMGPIGAALKYGYRYILFGMGQLQDVTSRVLRWSWHTSATANSWVASSRPMGRNGHKGAWDQRSSRLVHLWRDEENQIVLSHSSGTTDVVTPTILTGATYQAAATPSLVCGPSSITYNCLLVWAGLANNGDHYHKLYWYQFRVLGAGSSAYFDFAPLAYSNGYIQYGPPDVTYSGTSGSNNSFIVGFKNPGQCFFTMKKGVNYYDSFISIVGHCAGSGRYNGPPVLGNSSNTYTEAWSIYNSQ